MEQRIFSHPGLKSGGICLPRRIGHSPDSRIVIFALEEVVRSIRGLHSLDSRIVIFALEEVVGGVRAPFRLSGLS